MMMLAVQVDFGNDSFSNGFTEPAISSNFLSNPLWGTLLSVAILVFILFLGILFLRRLFWRKARMRASLGMKILLISVPKENSRNNSNNQQEEVGKKIQEEIGVAENIFALIGGLAAQKGPKHWLFGRTDHFSVEIVALGGKIYFYMAVPESLVDTIAQQIHASYPHSLIEIVEDYNIFSPTGAIMGTYLRLQRAFVFPIKTYHQNDSDALNTFTNTLSKLGEGEAAAIQFVVRSAHGRWHDVSIKVARHLQDGKSLGAALGSVGLGNFFDKLGLFAVAIFRLIIPNKKSENLKETSSKPLQQLSPMQQEVVKGIEEKASRAGLDVNIRVVVSAANKIAAGRHLDNLVNAFSQFNYYKYGNVFTKPRWVKQNKLISDFIQRSWFKKYNLILNAEEMASLWHLPLASSETPNIHWLEARKAPPPLNVPDAGIVLGENIYRGLRTVIKMNNEDRARHMYIIGKSGTGKSVLLSNMVIQDIKNGEGICVIDPHGDLVDAVLEHVPKERAEDVIYFDPSDTERPIGLNMLEFNNPEQKTFVVNEMISIFDKLYDLKASGGPMFEQYMRNAMLLMMEDAESGSTLLEVPKVLADVSFRKYKLSKCVNPVVKDFWEKEAEKAGGEASLANMVPYLTSKLTPFVSSDLMRPIIAQQKSSFNFREIMDTRKILLIKLAKGKIGDMSANLLGMVIVGKLLMAALSRVDLPEEQRNNFFLYIDEFQNFTTDSIAIILSEARKYRLCLTVAHQYINQLVKGNNTNVRDAVFGNVGTLAAFRIGPEDGDFMAKQFAPVFNQYDLVNVPKYNAYIKMLIDNQNPPAFNLTPYPPIAGDKSIPIKIKELSRLKYGRDRAVVESEILQRMRLVG